MSQDFEHIDFLPTELKATRKLNKIMAIQEIQQIVEEAVNWSFRNQIADYSGN